MHDSNPGTTTEDAAETAATMASAATGYQKALVTTIAMNNMNMRSDLSKGYPSREYHFYTRDIVYGFGYGLWHVSKYTYL
nr:probable beta-D-xylosidase 6 [Tanacetum cinerariifolium]